MADESIQIPDQFGDKIDILIRVPSGTNKFSVVVFVSGLGMSMHEWNNSFDEIAGLLLQKGIATVQFQFPIYDANKRVREIALSKRAAITQDVLAWVKTRVDIDTGKIGLFAMSYGVPTVLSLDLSFAKSLVFGSGAFYPQRSITKVYAERGITINYDGDTALPRSSGETTTVGREFWEDLKNFAVIGKVRLLTVPTMLTHGDRDTKVTTEEVKQIYDALGVKKKKLQIYKGGDHGISDVPRPIREQFLKDVIGWFTETLLT